MKVKINIYNFYTYALFFSLVKIYILPEGLRQFIKIIVLLSILIFIVRKSESIHLWNISLIYILCVCLSAIKASFSGQYGVRDCLDSILYSISFYSVYTYIGLCYYKGRFIEVAKCLYNIAFIYCVLTIISVLKIGISNNSNQAAYIFGNKFSSSYLFLFLLALYGTTHDMKKRNKQLFYYVLFAIALGFSLYVECATSTVTIIILLFMSALPDRFREILLNPVVVIISLIISSLIIVWIGQILELDLVNYIVSDLFNKTYTIKGRLEIYYVYLMKIILESFWFGYGYSNSIMYNLTGVYSNAQNGLFEIFVNLGFMGVISLLLTVFYCYKRGRNNENKFYLSIIVYGMIIASIFEISINWFFIIGITMVRWNCDAEV